MTEEQKFYKVGDVGDGEHSADVLFRIRKRIERSNDFFSELRTLIDEDIKFALGDQWPADIVQKRAKKRRPMLKINKLPTFINQIANDQRQNRPTINISPAGERTSVEAAKLFRGWIRALERESNADIAYDTAFLSAVTCGVGYWRIVAEYCDEDSFDQVLRVRRIPDPLVVYFDPDALDPTGADAEYVAISEMVPRDVFEAQYPDYVAMSFDTRGVADNSSEFWCDKDHVRVAEYYEVVRETRRIVALSNGHVGSYADLSDEVKAMITAGEMSIEKDREAEIKTITYYKVTGDTILEEAEWPGKYIPVVQVLGSEVWSGGQKIYAGIVRAAKDPMRMYNYWRSLEAELLALAPKAPYIIEEGQLEGHEAMWYRANEEAEGVLVYKGTSIAGKPAPVPQRQQFAASPQGVVQATQASAMDMQATTGIRFDATMNERMIDESGKAIRELRRSGDLTNFHYIDNLSRSLKHTGAILVDLAPTYLDTSRYVSILTEEDADEVIRIDPMQSEAFKELQDQETGKRIKVFNPKKGKYGVTVTVGPSFATKRIEASESMMSFVKSMPEVGQLIADLIAKNQDWPGAEEISRRLSKMLPPQVLMEDIKDLPPQVVAIVQQQQQQLQQADQQIQSLTMQLNDRTADRQVLQNKIDRDFEGKMFSILQKIEQTNQQVIVKAVTEAIKMAQAGTPVAQPSMQDTPEDLEEEMTNDGQQ